MKRVLTFLVCLLLYMSAAGEETRIIGEVLSATSGEPLQNVSVYFRGTKVGTTTDEHGLFYLHVELMRSAEIVVSFIGYKTQTFQVEAGKDAGLTVVLEERRHRLAEVEVLPGANLALPLMDSVRAHRRSNAPVAGSLVGEHERRYFLSDINGKTLKRRLWKSLESGMIRQEDSTYLLPLPQQLYTSLAVPVPEHLNFYDATIPFGSLSLLSPTAVSAPAYYQFFLVDSLEAPKRYIVHYRPKNAFDSLFTGSLTIDSATYALSDVQASIPREANVNYLSSLHYAGHYDLVDGGNRLAHEQMSSVLDIAVRTDSSHLFPSLLTRQSYTAAPMERIEPEQTTTRPVSPAFVSPTMKNDTSDLWLFRVASWIGYLVHTGYARTGTCIDIGNVMELLQFNRYETVHVGLPFRTNERLMKHVSLEGYIGYGFKDRGIKYKTQMQVILPTERRNILGIYWWDHYAYSEVSAFDELNRENSWVYGSMPFTMYLFSDVFYRNSHATTTSVRQREFCLRMENDWCSSEGARPAVETKMVFRLGRMGYGNAGDYHYYDMPSFRHSSFAGTVRLGWKERVVDIYTTRKHLYANYPTLFVGAEMGSWQFDQDAHYHVYGNLNVLLRQDVSLGMGGTLQYSLQAGIAFGKTPYPLLFIPNGNQTWTFAPERFTLMNNNQYLSDKFVHLHVNWNGQGLVFNRIPGVRYLRLRELAEFKIAYGGLSETNRLFNMQHDAAPVGTLRIPYVEVGIGIGNILRVGELYSVWRLTSTGDGVTPRWAIRFRIHLGL